MRFGVIQNLLPIAILKNINVGEDSRGEGVGTSLLEEFISEVEYDTSYIILIADTAERN